MHGFQLVFQFKLTCFESEFDLWKILECSAHVVLSMLLLVFSSEDLEGKKICSYALFMHSGMVSIFIPYL